MVGCLVLMVCLVINPGLCLLAILLHFILRAVWVLIRLISMILGLLLITGMRMILLLRCPIIQTSGLIGAEKTFLLLEVSKLLVLGFTSLLRDCL